MLLIFVGFQRQFLFVMFRVVNNIANVVSSYHYCKTCVNLTSWDKPFSGLRLIPKKVILALVAI